LRTTLLICLAAVVLAAVPARSGSSRVTVESASESGLEFVVDLGGIRDVFDADGKWIGARVPGFIELFEDSVGLHVPVSARCVAAPVGSHIICEVTDAIHYEIESYTLAELIDILGDRLGDIPRRAAEVTTDGLLGHQRVVGIRLAPLIYDERTGRLRIHRRFRVSVRFSGGDRLDAELGRRRLPESAASEVCYMNALLNYEQGKQWRTPLAEAERQDDYFSDAAAWIKVKVDTSGIFCITGSDLESIGVSISNIQSSSVRIYSGSGLPLRESLADHNPVWMTQMPIKVCDGGDGLFGRGDSILFYGLGERDWADLYDKSKRSDAYYKSFYSNYNCYWLTWGGTFAEPANRMETKTVPTCEGCPYYQPQSFLERLHMEVDLFDDFSIRAEDGWYWQPLRSDSPVWLTAHTPSPDAGRPAVIRVRVADWAVSDECEGYYYRMVLQLNNVTVQDTVWNHSRSFRNVMDVWGSGVPSGSGQQVVRIEAPSALPPPYTGQGVCKKLDLAWYEVFYWRLFQDAGSGLFVSAPDTTANVRYEIDGFDTPALYAFEISDQFDIKELSGIEISAGAPYSAAFFDTVRSGVGKHYALVAPQGMLKPAELVDSPVGSADIRYRPGAAYCVIAHEDLLQAAQAIAGFHAGRVVEGEAVTSEAVTTQQIYDEFGWGVPDATAIRDFLRWRYETGPLSWVLLLGDATWDYKGYVRSSGYPNYVSTYERRYVVRWKEPYNTDDWLAYLEPSFQGSTARWPTVAISRLPASSPEEADELVARSIDYIQNPEIGPWQNRVILISDDDRTPSGCDRIPHTRYAEELADDGYPAVMEQVKIYLHEYPRESTGLKPKAKYDFLDNLNKGALVTNFVGHGDEQRWCQEEVYNPAAKDLVNSGRRRTFLIAASCNVSRFDEPNKSSAGEDLLRRAEGGTIGSLASTHLCAAGANQALNLSCVQQLFQPGFKGRTVSIGDAVKVGKFETVTATLNDTYSRNNEMYALFGDPLLELATPRMEVVFTSAPDTLERKGIYQLTASIYDGSQPAGWPQGSAEIWLREAEDTSGYVDCNTIFFDYEIEGSEIFRGRSPVSDGGADFGFFVASGAREGPRATVRCFATDGLSAASGLLDSVSMYGEGLSDDDIGPEIELVCQGSTVVPGDTLIVGSRVDLNLTDESGVAVKGKSEFIPAVSVAYDDIERVDLTDSVYAVEGDFSRSNVSFIVPQLATGVHTLSIAAFDNLNNLSTADYEVFIGTRAEGAARVVYVYPNPSHDVCYIIWDYENNEYVEVEATIYTISGRKIWTGSTSGQGSYHEIMWDGRDVVGDPVANGTYLVVVKAVSPLDPGFGTTDRVVLTIIR
jgi:hypothetical protein